MSYVPEVAYIVGSGVNASKLSYWKSLHWGSGGNVRRYVPEV